GNIIASSIVLTGLQNTKFIIPLLFTYLGIYLILLKKLNEKEFFHLDENQIKNYFWDSNEGLILTDNELRIEFINEKAKKLVNTGFREDFLIGSKILFPVSEMDQKISKTSTINLAEDTHIEVKYVKAEWMGEPVYLIITKDVTSKVRNEREEKRLSVLQSKMIQFSGEGILLIDKDGLVSFANPEALKLLELEESELIGEFLPNVVHETSSEGTSVEEENFPVRSTYEEGEPCYVTFDLFWRKDGSYFFVEYHGTPVYINGELEGAVMIFRDVSERKAKEDNDKRYADEILHLSNTSNKFLEIYTEPELYRYIASELGNMTGGSCIIVNHYDPINNLFTTKNTAGFEKFQTEIYSLIGRDIKDMIYSLEITEDAYKLHTSDFSEKIPEGLHDLRYGELNRKTCIQLEKITGTQSVYSFVLNYKGQFLGNVIILHKRGYLENRAMLEVFQSQASINLHRRLVEKNIIKDKFRNDTLIQETSAMFVEMRYDGTILFINPSLEDLSGYTNEEVMGKNWWSLFEKGAPYVNIQEFLVNVKRSPVKAIETNFQTRKGYDLKVKWDWVYKFDADSGEELLNALGLEVKV
ncbi:MAG: PAS domain S-box protein, partial [Leptospiraceae bacterium]|nr:PAS domain S-box protein [Leptospiraceae bacterium]